MSALNKLTGYSRLLLAANPSKLEVGTLLVGFASAIASGVPFPIIGIIFGQLLDDFNAATCDQPTGPVTSGEGSQSDVNSKILIIVYLALAQVVTIYLHLLCWSLSGNRLAQRLREKYIETLLRQEPSYFDKLPPGEVAARLDGDIQTIRSGTSEKVGICLASLSFFVTAYVVAFIKDARLAGMLVSLVPAYFLMSFVGSHYIEKYAGRMSEHAAAAASIASEALSNFVVVSAFGASGRLEEKFSTALAASEREGIKKATAVGVQTGFLYFIAYGANGLAFWQGSRRIADVVQRDIGGSGTTVGAVFTVIFILVEATLLLSQVAPFLHLFSAAVASFEKLRGDLDRQSLIDGTAGTGSRLPQAEGGFEFQNVSFTFPSRPDTIVLDDLSLKISSNQHTAIVGLSGSGKSTIAGLAMRLYDPNEGKILFDGQDIRDIHVGDFRSFVSLVQQDACLLDRSILENVAHGLINSSDATHDELKKIIKGSELSDLAAEVRDGIDLMAAAEKYGSAVLQIIHLVQQATEQADASGFISRLQQGYGTVVGSSGRLLSGGQKQRVALARALIKSPRVLILDEATASLDSASEDRIQRAIAKLTTSRTIVTIAHRLSTIYTADNIVVMQKGKIVEQGTHAALMAKNGTYASLVKMQTLQADNDKSVIKTSNDAHNAEAVDSDPEQGSISADSFEQTEKSNFKIGQSAASASTPDEGEEEEVEEPPTPAMSLWALVQGYAPALRPHTLTILIALLGSTIVGGAFSGEAVIFGNTVGSLSPCNTPSYIRSRGDLFGLMFFVLAIIEFFANLVSCAGFGWVSERMVYTVRVLSFRSLFEQSLQWHQSDNRTPALSLSYITRDGAALAGLSGSVIGTLFSISVNLIAAIILTHIIAWRIALVCLALVPLLLGAGLMELRVLGKFEEKHETAYTHSVAIGVEAVTSIKLIASLSLEEATLQTYRRSLAGPRRETLSVTMQASLWQAMTYFLGNLVNALAYWWGAKQIIAGNYTQTQFLIVVFSLLVSALLWSQMFALAPELSSARSAMARILGLINQGSDKMQGRVPVTPLPLESRAGEDVEAANEKQEEKYSPARQYSPGSVQFSNVSFSYPARPDMPVLNGLTLTLQPGKFHALVGPSGAGKSTIISLLERLYTPSSGTILINNRDINKVASVTFRDTTALVPQENVLFEGSVAFNIGLGAAPGRTASAAEIQRACELANIHTDILALPQGYDTLCGPNGSQFSGGQKQRLAIARALVRKPSLLILDEPTSALDAESEMLLQRGLDAAVSEGGMTVLAIAHRLRTIRKADRIFMIEGGVVVDQGTHEELMQRSEGYRVNVMYQSFEGEE